MMSSQSNRKRAAEQSVANSEYIIIVGIDFGTTFAALAMAKVPRNQKTRLITKRDIVYISNWPREPLDDTFQVPSEIWYVSHLLESRVRILTFDKVFPIQILS